jgi:hypothetical protein
MPEIQSVLSVVEAMDRTIVPTPAEAAMNKPDGVVAVENGE